MKVSELIGPALDYAVALIECDQGWLNRHLHLMHTMRYSTDWELGGPIIENEKISIISADDEYLRDENGYCTNKRVPNWFAEHGGGHSPQESQEGNYYDPRYEIDVSYGIHGPTPLIAAMRCYVTSKLGTEIDIPGELL